jgi:hypothetical protein
VALLTSAYAGAMVSAGPATCAELFARADVELAVDPAEVLLQVLTVTNSAWAMSLLLRPSAAICATRRSLAVSAIVGAAAGANLGLIALDVARIGERTETVPPIAIPAAEH